MIEVLNPDGESHSYLYRISDVSQVLNLRLADGRHVGRNLLFKILRNPANRILQKDNKFYQNPWINLGLGCMHIVYKHGGAHAYIIPLFYESGIAYLKRGIASGKIVVQIEGKDEQVPKTLPF
jgi:hypothetical protein